MTKPYPLIIKIISALTLVIFTFTQVAWGYDECRSVAPTAKSHLRVQEAVSSAAGKEIADALGAPAPVFDGVIANVAASQIANGSISFSKTSKLKRGICLGIMLAVSLFNTMLFPARVDAETPLQPAFVIEEIRTTIKSEFPFQNTDKPRRSGRSKIDWLKATTLSVGTSYLLRDIDRGLANKGLSADNTFRLFFRSLIPLPSVYFHEYNHARAARDLAPGYFREPNWHSLYGYDWRSIAIMVGSGMVTGKLSHGKVVVPIGLPFKGMVDVLYKPDSKYPTLSDFISAEKNRDTSRQIYLAGPMSNLAFSALTKNTFDGLYSNGFAAENLSPYSFFSPWLFRSDGNVVFEDMPKWAQVGFSGLFMYGSVKLQKWSSASSFTGSAGLGILEAPYAQPSLNISITPGGLDNKDTVVWATWQGKFDIFGSHKNPRESIKTTFTGEDGSAQAINAEAAVDDVSVAGNEAPADAAGQGQDAGESKALAVSQPENSSDSRISARDGSQPNPKSVPAPNLDPSPPKTNSDSSARASGEAAADAAGKANGIGDLKPMIERFKVMLNERNSGIVGIDKINSIALGEAKIGDLDWYIFPMGDSRYIELFVRESEILAYGIVTFLQGTATLRFQSFEKSAGRAGYWGNVYRERMTQLRLVLKSTGKTIKTIIVPPDQILSEDQLTKRVRAYFKERPRWIRVAEDIIKDIRMCELDILRAREIIRYNNFQEYYSFGPAANFYVNTMGFKVAPAIYKEIRGRLVPVRPIEVDDPLLEKLKAGTHLNEDEIVELFSGRALRFDLSALNTATSASGEAAADAAGQAAVARADGEGEEHVNGQASEKTTDVFSAAVERVLSQSMRRRTFLKRVGIGCLGTAALGTLSAGVAYYEFATDHSFKWQPYSLVPENATRLNTAWDPNRPSQNIDVCFSRLVIDLANPEATRRSARNLRLTIKNTIDHNQDSAFMKTASGSYLFAHILDVIRKLDADQFEEFAVRWEIIRLKQELLALIKNYAESHDISRAHTEEVIKLFNELTRINYMTTGTKDPFLDYLLSSNAINMNSAELLTFVFHRDGFVGFYWVIHGLSENGENNMISTAAKDVLASYHLPSALTEEQARVLDDIVELLDARGAMYSTRASFDEAVKFYEVLRKGPVRSINVEDVEAVAYARQQLLPIARYFVDSGRLHKVPPDVLSAVALVNLLFNAYKPDYSFDDGFGLIDNPYRKEKRRGAPWDFIKWLVKKTPSSVKKIEVQDRASDYIAGRIMGSIPTLGLLQVRAGPSGLNEWNVRENHLFSRWMSDQQVARLSLRGINGMLLDPKWNVEAASTAYEQLLGAIITKQRQGKYPASINLEELKKSNWQVFSYNPIYGFLGPDPLIAIESGQISLSLLGINNILGIENAMNGWGIMPYLLHTRILALESGLFDKIPAKIVGLSDSSQLEILFRTAQSSDSYLRDAAVRSLQELAQEQAFPGREKAVQWLQAHHIAIPAAAAARATGEADAVGGKALRNLTLTAGLLLAPTALQQPVIAGNEPISVNAIDKYVLNPQKSKSVLQEMLNKETRPQYRRFLENLLQLQSQEGIDIYFIENLNDWINFLNETKRMPGAMAVTCTPSSLGMRSNGAVIVFYRGLASPVVLAHELVHAVIAKTDHSTGKNIATAIKAKRKPTKEGLFRLVMKELRDAANGKDFPLKSSSEWPVKMPEILAWIYNMAAYPDYTMIVHTRAEMRYFKNKKVSDHDPYYPVPVMWQVMKKIEKNPKLKKWLKAYYKNLGLPDPWFAQTAVSLWEVAPGKAIYGPRVAAADANSSGIADRLLRERQNMAARNIAAAFLLTLRASQINAVKMMQASKNIKKYAIVINADNRIIAELNRLGFEIIPAENVQEAEYIKSRLSADTYIVVINENFLNLKCGNISIPNVRVDEYFINLLQSV